ncbi:type II toxin-antitoxin system ParD family antitoxin, partial [Clavibacter michiganensis]|uniref:type II toxin-antitoxin system ParD family antitoxin n=1 Tax=Clavibacter michiganensis TaxID=28447 RepID=UPI00374E1481
MSFGRYRCAIELGHAGFRRMEDHEPQLQVLRSALLAAVRAAIPGPPCGGT